jgi:hypothetical protein
MLRFLETTFMKNKNISFGLLLAGLCAFQFLESRGHASTRLLPFQGRLSDANGQAIPDGARVVQFKIYDAPIGGRAVWNGEVQKLSVNGGLVSTLLGTKADLSSVDFNREIYLELTIDANGDGLITPADPPLLPRQSILPAVFAVESANTRLLEGYGWSALFGTNNPADGTFLDSKIGDGTLTTPKFHDAAVTSAKIANGAVTRPKLDVTGASAGQALTFNGTQVVWSQVNASNAITANNAIDSAHLQGFDWTALFNNGNPQSGIMGVAGFVSRGSADVLGSLTVSGVSFLNGSSTVVQGLLVAPSVGINMALNDWGLYLRGVGDFNHYLKWGNGLGNQSGFDGPMLVGNLGGVLGTVGNWTLRWNSTGNVQTRGTISSGSDRNLKENFATVDADDVLAKVAALPITRWNYKAEPSAEHIGPVAQDFRAAFGLGSDDKSIAMVDSDGVALAAIQGLNNKVDQKSSELLGIVKQQQEQIEALKAEIAALKARK